jgi:hypothetical protein
MRSQTYGDKQRDAQRRKKEEELWEKSNPEGAPTSDAQRTQTNRIKPNKTKKKIRLTGVLPTGREPDAP